MKSWQKVAHEHFPEFHGELADRFGLGLTGLWVELSRRLVEAYEVNPVNDDLIRRIYKYAAWCLEHPQTKSAEAGEDPSSAVAVGLIEDLPLYPHIADDLYRWMSLESFQGFENLFRYHLDDAQYRKFVASFQKKKKYFVGPAVI